MFQKLKKDFLAENSHLYLDEIRTRNYKSFRHFSIVGLSISIAMLLFSLLLKKIITFNMEFLIFACYFICMIYFEKVIEKKNIKHITLIFYIAVTPVMIMAILIGTFLDTTEPSITIMIFICVLPLFILDKPWRIFLYITIIALVYCICCYIAKDFELFMEDFIDIVAFYILAIGVNFFILKDRLENVENYIKVREKSEIDPLTGIYNRGIGAEKITKLINQEVYGAFCIFDIDNFKHINDTYGHSCGDEVLQEIANVTRTCLSNNDVFFRMGGDEFIIYSVGCVDELQYKKAIDNLYEKIRAIKISSINNEHINISLGCCIFNEKTTDYNELYKYSDKALYESKSKGKGRDTLVFLNDSINCLLS